MTARRLERIQNQQEQILDQQQEAAEKSHQEEVRRLYEKQTPKTKLRIKEMQKRSQRLNNKKTGSFFSYLFGRKRYKR